MIASLTHALGILSRRRDLVLTILVLLAIVMIILPLPTPLVDALITANIGLSILVLLVAFYVAQPVAFSSLPSVILIATVLRLAITITTSRLILLQADAGQIISAFGNFVVGGDVAVGLVIFVIISIAQFVVITKGGERVAEVAARFSLDAMPGRQMSIDSDLRNGDIDQAEARRLRRALERESHLYGAMDGAMKFVKGDAIASLIVILVNLIGGLIVGTMRQGMSLGAAAETYSLLTVGDGLVAQIPSLLVSVAAGTVVTRVASEGQHDLSTEVVGQLFNDHRALLFGATILIGLAFAPGFPTLAFLALAMLFAMAGFWIYRRAMRAEAAAGLGEEPAALPARAAAAIAPAGNQPERLEPPRPPDASIVVWVGGDLARSVPFADFEQSAQRVRADLFNDLGVEVPSIALRVDGADDPEKFRIDLEGVPAASGAIPPDGLLVEDDPVHVELLNVPYRQELPMIGRRPAIWVGKDHEAALSEAAIVFLAPLQVLVKCLTQTLYRRASHFVGIQETRKLLTGIQPNYAELVKEAEKVAPLQKITEILRRLVDENVPVRNLRAILEAIVEWGQREPDVVLLVEYVRMALGRHICFRYADGNRVIAAYMLERSVEETLRAGAHRTTAGTFMSIPSETVRPVIDQLAHVLAATVPDACPVLLASMDVRRLARTLLMRNDIDIAVLSYQELAPEFNVQPLGTLTQDGGSMQERADVIGEPAEQLLRPRMAEP
jgi:type III secretion protein V